MARLFDDASSEYLTISSSPVSGSMQIAGVAWFRSDDATTSQVLLDIRASGGATTVNSRVLRARGDRTGDPVDLVVAGAGASSTIETTTGWSVNTWHCAAFTTHIGTGQEHRVWLDAGGLATTANIRDPSGLNLTSIGRQSSTSPGGYMSGRIAEVAVWDLDGYGATDAGRADAFANYMLPALSQGVSPACFRAGLKAHWCLIGSSSPETDFVGGYNLTLSGTTKAEHPRIIVPHRPQLIVPNAAPPAGATPKNVMYGALAGPLRRVVLQ